MSAIAEIAVRWDGVLLDDHLLFVSGEYTRYVISGLTASSSATPLKIYLGNHNVWAYTHIDDISVYGTIPQVPEPGVAGMLLIGLGTVAYAARRRRPGSRAA